MVKTGKIEVNTYGNCDVIGITSHVTDIVSKSGVAAGSVTVFNIGSTAGITTVEFEPGLVKYDLKAVFERISPKDGSYEHEKTWGDDNGHSHVCASLLGPSLTVPVLDGKLVLGTWQQIVLVDFDTRARKRTVICQVTGDEVSG